MKSSTTLITLYFQTLKKSRLFNNFLATKSSKIRVFFNKLFTLILCKKTNKTFKCHKSGVKWVKKYRRLKIQLQTAVALRYLIINHPKSVRLLYPKQSFLCKQHRKNCLSVCRTASLQGHRNIEKVYISLHRGFL